MFAQTPLRRASAGLVACLIALVLATTGRSADLGLNPSIGTGSQTLSAIDLFTGTLSVGTAGVSGGTLTLAADYTTGQSLTFTGTSSTLTYSSPIRTLTLQSTSTFLRTGTGTTTVHANLSNQGTVSVTGGTLTLNGTFTNATGATAGVSGSGSVLTLVGAFTNAGTLSATSSGVINLNGTVTTANLGTVTLTSGGRAVLNGTITNTAATLNAPGSGSYELSGGTVVGGTVASGALTFTSSGGTLNGVTLTGTVTLPASTYANLSNTAALTGATVTFGNNAYLYLSNANAALTINSASSLTGDIRILDSATGTALTNAGSITQTHSSGGELYAKTFTNSGTITSTSGILDLGSTSGGYATINTATGTIIADGSGAGIDLNGSVANSGVIKALNSGVLAFYGTNTTDNLGTIQLASGTHAYLKGTLNNVGSTLTAPTGGIYELSGGTVTGGTVASNALTLTTSGGTLDGATLTGTVSLPASTYSNLANTVTFSNAAVTFGNNAYLYLSNANAALNISALTTLTGDVRILDNGSTGTVLTNAGTINHTHSSGGELYAKTFTNSGTITSTSGILEIGSTTSGYTTTNTATGVIVADGSGATVYLSGSVANSGVLRAQNSGILALLGTNTTGNLGTVQLLSGGRVLIKGNLTNTAATLTPPSGGSYELSGGTITGGTVTSNALSFTSSGGTLNGPALAGTVNLPASTYANVAGNTTLTTGLTTFGNNAYLYLSNTNARLEVDSAATVTGDVRIIDSGATGTVLVNQGVITHTHASSGELYAKSFTNANVINGTAGTLQIGSSTSGYNTSNSGTITASNAAIELYGNVANSGLLAAENNGTLAFLGTNTTGNLGTVQLSSGGHVYLKGTLTNTSATLTAPSGGSYELAGGTITGGTVSTGALSFTSSGGTLNGVTLTGAVSIPANTYANIAGLTSLASAAVTFGNNAYFYLSNTSASLSADAPSTLTGDIRIIADSSTGTSFTNAGTITHTHSSGGEIYAKSVTNSGTITGASGTLDIGSTTSGYNTFNTGSIIADGSGTTVELNGNVANTGILRAQNFASLAFLGTNTTGNLGTVQIATGGHVYLKGTLTNTAATLTAPSGGRYELSGGTVTGGTVASNALTFTSSGGTLNGPSLTGTVSLTANTYANLAGATAFSSAAVTFGNNAYLYLSNNNATLGIDSLSTVTGDIRIIADSSTGTAVTTAGALTHTSSTSGELYARTVTNSGSILASAGTFSLGTNSTGYVTVNTGTITADGVGTTIYVTGNLTNTGTITVQNSALLRFNGTNTTGITGNVQIASGGRALIEGTLTNSGTLAVPGGGSMYELYGGTIVGGSIAPGALTFTSNGGTLNNVSFGGDFATPSGTYVYFTNGTTFTGANATFDTNSGIYWQQVSTLSGKSITFANNSYLYVSNTNSALTLASTTSATGNIRLYSDGSSGTAITNQGTLTHTLGSGQMYARTLTNTGSITATAGSLTFGNDSSGYDSFNSGTITASGSGVIVYVTGNVTNTGTLSALNSGELRFAGTNATGNLGTVTLASAGRALLTGTLTNTAATLAKPTGGAFELLGGSIVNGSVASGALSFTSSGGTLNNVSLAGDLSFANSSSYAYFTNGTTFTGANASLASSSGIYWQQTGTLTGKSLSLASNAYLYVSGTNSSLTLAPSTTVSGDVRVYSDGSTGTAIVNQGTFTHTLGSGQAYARSLLNSGTITATAGSFTFGNDSSGYLSSNTGTITADGSGVTVYLTGNVTNTGTLVAQNSGELRFNGTNSTGNLGAVTLATGGRALLNGTLSNTAATLTKPTGGSFELYSGTIHGGSVASGALTFTSSGGTLNGVTITGDLSFPSSSYAYFTGGTTFSGTNATFASSGGIYWQQVGTLIGKNLSLGSNAYLYVTGANNALTLAPSTTLTGNVRIYSDGSSGTAITTQGTIVHNSGTGQMYASTLSNSGGIVATAGTLNFGTNTNGYDSFNSGAINANGGTINIAGTTVNTGVLTASNSGELRFTGTTTTANLGTVTLSSGGRALLTGTLNNTAATLPVPTGGYFELYGGTINGGNLAGGSLGLTSNGGTLNGVTLLGDFGAASGTTGTVTGGSTFTGANGVFAPSSSLYWQQVGTLTGKTITMSNNAYVYVTGANNGLTLSPTTSITGDITLYTDGSAGTAITNQGTLTHNTGTGYLYGTSVTNTGAIVATSGTLNLGTSSTGYSFTNGAGGSITVSGGTITMNATSANPIVNQGTIAVQSGTLFTNGRVTNGANGTISGAGTISGGLTVAGGTLAPGNSIGTLTLTNGAFAITSATVFAVELGGATADLLVFQNPTGTVNLGAGLLSISLNILSAPTAGTTYNLVQITSGGSGISGTFAGLPTSGSSFVASYQSVPYTFTVNYSTNLVSMSVTPVPEPSTWALILSGLVLGAWYYRRRA